MAAVNHPIHPCLDQSRSVIRLHLTLLLGITVLLAACGSGSDAVPDEPSPVVEAPEATSPFRNVQKDVEFVGDAVCFDCHEDLWRGYQEHGMAQS